MQLPPKKNVELYEIELPSVAGESAEVVPSAAAPSVAAAEKVFWTKTFPAVTLKPVDATKRLWKATVPISSIKENVCPKLRADVLGGGLTTPIFTVARTER